jgi:phenylacetate-CoA ligase
VPPSGLAEAIGKRIREALVFTAKIELVQYGSLQRSEYKSKLVKH